MSFLSLGARRLAPALARRAWAASPRAAVALPPAIQRTPSRIAVQSTCTTHAAYATEKDNSVSFHDPTEQEAQRFLELGTIALEVGDLEKAMVCRCS